jgi:hypothetical protein
LVLSGLHGMKLRSACSRMMGAGRDDARGSGGSVATRSFVVDIQEERQPRARGMLAWVVLAI